MLPSHPDPLACEDCEEFPRQTGFKTYLIVPVGVAGLFVVLIAPQSVIYVGPFWGMCAVYDLWRWIMRFACSRGATQYEIERRP